MCSTNKDKTTINTRKTGTRRVKLWELENHLHCPVLGTCLTMNELRKVQRQCGMQFETPPRDYHLHSAMVHEAKTNGRPAHCLHKLLDKKYQRWINQWSRQAERNNLDMLWDKAVKSGDIPGNFWALITHPNADRGLLTHAYGDVHMLSHLQGASNRADLRRIEGQQQEIEVLKATLNELRQSSRDKIIDLESKFRVQEQSLQAQLVLTAQAKHDDKGKPLEVQQLEKENRLLEKRLHWTEDRLAGREILLSEMEEQVIGLKEQVEEYQQQYLSTTEPANKPKQSTQISLTKNQSLNGKKVLYVGGRATLLPHLRELVENHQGKFDHHDGGLEDSRAGLNCQLEKADMVFCPVDCISHDACLKVKHYCKKMAKPFIPLRSSGVSTFNQQLNRLCNNNNSKQGDIPIASIL